MCPWQYYLQYLLGIKSKPNFRTEKGSIVHKALELLAHKKLAEQEGRNSFIEPELDREFNREEITVDCAVTFAFRHYALRNESEHNWSDEDWQECLESTHHVVNYNNGMFNPLNRHIICPEQYFDLQIDEPWAKYYYKDPYTLEPIEGVLSLRGSVDLLTEVNSDTLEYLDWKNGRRFNWGTFKVKEYFDLERDPQLLMYFYALTRLYPNYKYIITTIFFARDGGPFSICLDRDRDVPYILNLLERRFNAIRSDYRPKRRWDNKLDRQRICKSFCYYGKNSLKPGEPPICEKIHQEFVQLGMDRTTIKYGRPDAYRQYGSGGGTTDRDIPKEKQ